MRRFLVAACLILFLAGLSLSSWFAWYVFSSAPSSGEVLVDIPKGAGIRDIKTLLGRKGVIRDDLRFLVLMRLLQAIERQHPPTLRAGEFLVPLGLTPLQTIRFLDQAKPVQHWVTIPEGLTMRQIAAVFAKDGWADAAVFLRLCQDRDFIRSLGIKAVSLEGYLFPETYSVVRGTTDERSLISRMVRRFFTVWNRLEKPANLRLNQYELLTLASIIEKETGSAEERELIAGVFYNRLRKGMRLQSDPTVIYGIPDFNGNLTRTDLRAKTPYNTYVISGLPPGPICNPGQAALEAALRPAAVPYLYFVAKNDGSHQFSRTLKEHNRAVQRYQRP